MASLERTFEMWESERRLWGQDYVSKQLNDTLQEEQFPGSTKQDLSTHHYEDSTDDEAAGESGAEFYFDEEEDLLKIKIDKE